MTALRSLNFHVSFNSNISYLEEYMQSDWEGMLFLVQRYKFV